METKVNHPRISLCKIVPASDEAISACLASIRPWIDEIVLIDTGSTDDEPDKQGVEEIH